MKKIKIYMNAPITLCFVGICVIATILGFITNDFTTDLLFSTYRDSLINPFMYIRLIGHVFGHADFEHLLNNMMFILLLGPILEDKYKTKLIAIILVVAISTGILNNVFTNHALLGASGVAFAFILLASITGDEEGIPVTLIIIACIWVGKEMIDMFMVNDDISQMTHILGALMGAMSGLYLKRRN